MLIFLRALLFVLLVPGYVFAQPAPDDGLLLVDHLESLYTAQETPPPANALWQADTLPFSNRDSRLQQGATPASAPYVWFRFPVERPATDSPHGLYFWRFNLAIAVYFNGVELARSPEREGWQTMSWNHPLLVSIQPLSWREEGSEVMVRLTRSSWGGNFAPIVFGELSALTPLYRARMFRQVELNEILLAFGFGLSLMSFILWLTRRRDTVYLWFSGMCFFWSVVTSHMVILLNPIAYDHWLPLVHASIDASIACMYGFIGRLIETVKRAMREKLVLLWAVLASLIHVASPTHLFFITAYSMHLLGILALSVIVIRVVRLAVKERNTPAIIVSLSLLVQIGLFSHNFYLMFFGTTAEWEGNIFYAHFGIPLLFLVFIGTLLWRFNSALTIAETMNRDLESRIEASRKVIEHSFAQRRRLELQQAAEQERLAIYRELHDDVGSKLLSIVHADQSSKLSDMARSALESLRHAVSRANHPDQLLKVFLADIREESELRLEGSGHEVRWTQRIPGQARIVPSRLAFTVNRILKEVVSNIIRHAGAHTVAFEVKVDGHSLHITVTDDGRGFELDGPKGNGIHNIRSRADEIGALASWQSGPGQGTRFSITVMQRLLSPDEAETSTVPPS